MGEETPGFVIGLREVWNEVRGLNASLNGHMAAQDLKVQAIDHRVSAVESRQAEQEKESLDTKSLRRQVWFALLSSFLLPIIVAVVTAIILK
jgi:hypothetical protein